METYRQLTGIVPLKESILTVGTFDGLHLGHQAVIGKTCQLARERGVPSVVVTFDPHPRTVLGPDNDSRPKLILGLDEKLRRLEELGVDTTLVIEFTLQFSQMTASNFLRDIVVPSFRPSTVVVGYDNRFGHNREGDANFLKNTSKQFHFAVIEVTEVSSQAQAAVSSSRIRHLLQAGECEAAQAALGRPYGFRATVVAGDGRGRKIGFPTANLEPLEPDQLLPKGGVYIASASLAGQQHYGMANIGTRPTFGGGDRVTEIHLFSSGLADFYGQTLELAFLHHLRDEQKFENAEALINQLEEDREASLKWINEHQEGTIVHAVVD